MSKIKHSLLCAALLTGELQAASLLLKNGVIHTVSGETLRPGAVLVEGGRITRVQESIEVAADETIDLNGHHLYPGLIAATTTLGLVEIAAVRATRDYLEVGEYTPDVRSWLAFNPDSELIAPARMNGITHVVPVPTGGIVTGLSGLIRLDGWTVEDMAVKAPVALHLFWPSMDLDTRPKESLPPEQRERHKSLEEQAKERRARIREIEDFFAEAEAYFKTERPIKQQVPAWEALRPVVKGEIPIIIHADDHRQIKAALEWGRARKLKIAIAGGRDAWKLAKELAEQEVPVIYERMFHMGNNLAATPGRDVDSYDISFRVPVILQEAGVKVVISEGLGGDSASGLRNLPYAAGHAVAFGLPEEQALKAMTLYPAQIYGLADHLGAIEPGKEASFFVATGSLLDIRTQVTGVWIAGRKIPLESRHTRLYEKYRTRPKRN